MPLLELQQGPQSLSRFGVLGTYAEALSRFVTHVGFSAATAESLETGHITRAVHMRPPLETDGLFEVHAAAHIPLTNSEMKEIEAWMEEIADEYEVAGVANSSRKQYTIAPPWEDVRDAHTGVRRYRRYSCAGFVLDGHRQVEIELLNLDEDSLPEVDREIPAAVYAVDQSNPQILAQFGLDGKGPWRLVLPGYVMRALDRSSEEIRSTPYQANEGDELMP